MQPKVQQSEEEKHSQEFSSLTKEILDLIPRNYFTIVNKADYDGDLPFEMANSLREYFQSLPDNPEIIEIFKKIASFLQEKTVWERIFEENSSLPQFKLYLEKLLTVANGRGKIMVLEKLIPQISQENTRFDCDDFDRRREPSKIIELQCVKDLEKIFANKSQELTMEDFMGKIKDLYNISEENEKLVWSFLESKNQVKGKINYDLAFKFNFWIVLDVFHLDFNIRGIKHKV